MGNTRRDLKTHRWRQTRQLVLDRDGRECQIGGPGCRGVATEVDHIIPHAHGGDDSLGNLRAACKPCNGRAGARARGAGFSEPRSTHAPPSLLSLAGTRETPMRTRVHRALPS